MLRSTTDPASGCVAFQAKSSDATWLAKVPLGRLPGDIHVHRENFSLHFPLMTSIVVSVVVSLLLWWWRK